LLESKTLNRLKTLTLYCGCEHGWSGWREKTRVDLYQGMVNGKQILKRRNPVKNCQQDASIMFQVKFQKTKPSGAFGMNQFQVFPAAYEFQLDLVNILADDLTLHLAGNGFLKSGKVGLEQFFQ